MGSWQISTALSDRPFRFGVKHSNLRWHFQAVFECQYHLPVSPCHHFQFQAPCRRFLPPDLFLPLRSLAEDISLAVSVCMPHNRFHFLPDFNSCTTCNSMVLNSW